jgi:hypothetical protein
MKFDSLEELDTPMGFDWNLDWSKDLELQEPDSFSLG